ncbi:MAG: alanine racemase [Alistipes sp.]|nr:alanine racemase [Alistipes sp.]MBO5972452.1 alanine racemase [Alistipes sp.]
MNYLLSDIARIVGGELLGEDLRVTEIATDSRSVIATESVVFAAIDGKNHDGHQFIGRMAERGVEAYIVERDTELPTKRCGMVRVDSTLAALQSLAAYHRSQFKGDVVAITGSNGKTIVKEWAARSMPDTVGSFASPKSYNSQLGVALSLLMLNGNESVAFIEAGISQPGEMERLEQMIKPDIVVITSIGDAHSANFSSDAEKIEEKLRLASGAKTIIYSSEYPALAKRINELYGDRELIDSSKESVDYSLELSDALSVDALHVSSLMRKLGYGVDGAIFSAKVSMRLELKEGIDNSMIIDDSYNSDINSVLVALDALHVQSMGRRRVAVISDIRQSGMPSEELYSRVAEAVRRAGVDKLIGVGENISCYASLFPRSSSFYHTTDELIENFTMERWAHSVILLKGSRDSRFERLARLLERRTHTTTLEVDLAAMKKNLNYFRRHLPQQHPLIAMVKAVSYGMGDVDVARMLQHEGVKYLAVAFADEGITLRSKGITMPIVVLNADQDSFDVMIAHDLEPEIYSFHSLDAFRRAALRAHRTSYPIHIKLDTGMHRLGFMEDDVDLLGRAIHLDPVLHIASIFSHLSTSDMPSEDAFTHEQIERFEYMSSQLIEWLDYTPLRHIANSAAIVRFPESHFDMCRLGLGLYGIGYEHNEELIPVASLSTRIVQIKNLAKGESVGYGRAARLERDTITATIPVGYADGLDRHLGNGRWSVRVNGVSAPIIGRVCMDSAMIDITNIPGVEVGDKVTIFGAERGNTLEDMAQVLDTITYEIMTSISQRVKRIYTER